MPSVYQLKPRFQALLRPVMRALAHAGWSPNAVTLLALAGSVVVGAAISQARARRGELFDLGLLPALGQPSTPFISGDLAGRESVRL